MIVRRFKSWSGRVPETAKTIFALPLCQVANAVGYARTCDGWLARIWGFLRFLPNIAVSTAIWLAGWFLAVVLALMIVS